MDQGPRWAAVAPAAAIAGARTTSAAATQGTRQRRPPPPPPLPRVQTRTSFLWTPVLSHSAEDTSSLVRQERACW